MKSQNQSYLHRLLVLFFLVFIASTLRAQDIIVMKKDGETIKARVVEVGLDEIKYKPWPLNETDPVIVLDKRQVHQIMFESGTVLNFFVTDMDDPKNYEGQRKDMIKLDMIAPTLGLTSLAYEHNIRPGRSYELGLGIIGAGVNTGNVDLLGAFVRVGYKFINTPDIYSRGFRYTHLLKGAYIRPDLTFADYSYTGINFSSNTLASMTIRTTGAAFIVNFGKQYVFSNRFAVDIFVGLGAGMQKIKPIEARYRSNFLVESFGFSFNPFFSVGPAWQGGIKLGLLTGSGK